PSYADLQRVATEALEQQAATAEILRVISQSPTDVQPVFDSIVRSAARLCSANDAQVLRVEGEELRLVAAHGTPSMPSVRRLTRGHVVGRAVIDRKTIHVRDHAQARAEYTETTGARYGVQSALAVPLLCEGVALGVIRISRTEIRPFTDNQIALLQTFADQAVIAIENVRLFTELQEKNRALTQAHAQVSETLDQQTATSEILRVISGSPTDVQPVFDIIVENAGRLCDAVYCVVYRFDGALVHVAAHRNMNAAILAELQRLYPRALDGKTVVGRSILDCRPFQVEDARSPEAPPMSVVFAERLGYRTLLSVPMLREGIPVGAIALARREAGLFTVAEVELVRTFADQAVIAIEN